MGRALFSSDVRYLIFNVTSSFFPTTSFACLHLTFHLISVFSIEFLVFVLRCFSCRFFSSLLLLSLPHTEEWILNVFIAFCLLHPYDFSTVFASLRHTVALLSKKKFVRSLFSSFISFSLVFPPHHHHFHFLLLHLHVELKVCENNSITMLVSFQHPLKYGLAAACFDYTHIHIHTNKVPLIRSHLFRFALL